MKHKHWSIVIGLLVVASMVLSACATPTPEVIEKVVTQIIKETVKETVIVEGTPQVVEKEVTKIVEKVVTATPLPPGADKQGGTLVMGYYQEPELLNPFIRTQTIAHVTGEYLERGLLQVQPDANFAPDLATEVPTVQNGGVSEDGMTVIYNLKENIVWSDGEPFDCDDVLFTWEAIMHPESGASETGGYQDMGSVTCEGKYKVVVKYDKFFAP